VQEWRRSVGMGVHRPVIVASKNSVPGADAVAAICSESQTISSRESRAI
jgi:hypothetical protein